MLKHLILSCLIVFAVVGYIHLKHYRQAVSEFWKLRDTLLVDPQLGVESFCVSTARVVGCQLQLRINGTDDVCQTQLTFKPRRYYYLSLVCAGLIWQGVPVVEVRVFN